MKVLDHEPQSWFLLEAGDGLLFDANCSHKDIHNSVPILEASTSVYKDRRLSPALEVEVTEAIKAWRGVGEGGDDMTDGPL